MTTRKTYPSDLTEAQWQLIQPLLPCERAEGAEGRPREYPWREIVNAILYLARTGCQWRYLPHDLPPYWLVSHYYHEWRKNGVLERVHDVLRTKVRQKAGKQPEPSVVIVDSQSVPTTDRGGPHEPEPTIGYDAAKQVKGRKRHLIVDTLGLIWVLLVTAASLQDPAGAKRAFAYLEPHAQRLQTIYADARYGGTLPSLVQDLYGWKLEVVHKAKDQKGFVVLPKRWIVERTFAWFGKYRRLSKDYEFEPDSSAAMIHWAMIDRMSKVLTAT
jgi:putative transposase